MDKESRRGRLHGRARQRHSTGLSGGGRGESWRPMSANIRAGRRARSRTRCEARPYTVHHLPRLSRSDLRCGAAAGLRRVGLSWASSSAEWHLASHPSSRGVSTGASGREARGPSVGPLPWTSVALWRHAVTVSCLGWSRADALANGPVRRPLQRWWADAWQRLAAFARAEALARGLRAAVAQRALGRALRGAPAASRSEVPIDRSR